ERCRNQHARETVEPVCGFRANKQEEVPCRFRHVASLSRPRWLPRWQAASHSPPPRRRTTSPGAFPLAVGYPPCPRGTPTGAAIAAMDRDPDTVFTGRGIGRPFPPSPRPPRGLSMSRRRLSTPPPPPSATTATPGAKASCI